MFLDDAVRNRLVIDLKDRVVNAAGCYGDALQDLKVQELMKKDDDINWVLSLALDAASAHFSTVITGALKRAKASGLRHLEGVHLDAGLHGEFDEEAWTVSAENALHAISDDSIKNYTTMGLGQVKKGATNIARKAQNEVEKDEKEENLSYLDILASQSSVEFMRFGSHVAGTSNDAVLVVVWEGMDPVHHTKGAYIRALKEKLDRYRKSGVPELGGHRASDEFGGDIYRDARVVWVKELSGGLSLWYQARDGDMDPALIRPDDPDFARFMPKAPPRGFGQLSDPRGPATLRRRVPDEFATIALTRSEELWGPTPTIDDPTTVWMKHMGFDPEDMLHPKPKAPAQTQQEAFAQAAAALGVHVGKATP